jgi:3-methyladenine DNA glycosylase AlkD
MLAWSRSNDIRKRRSAIFCQITIKCDTDLDLLYRSKEPTHYSKDFFLRKAIGWALRQYAWTDSREVLRYVRAHEDRLSGLSRREALKNVQRPAALVTRHRPAIKASSSTREPIVARRR